MKWPKKERARAVAIIFFILEKKRMALSLNEAEKILEECPLLDSLDEFAIFFSLFTRIPVILCK